MKNYATKTSYEDYISISFYFDDDKLIEIGDKINALNESAYMNGYNWEIFLIYYLEKNNPEILEGLDWDSEAGMCAAYYEPNLENEKKAETLVKIIEHLVENEQQLYQLIKDEGDNIEWD